MDTLTALTGFCDLMDTATIDGIRVASLRDVAAENHFGRWRSSPEGHSDSPALLLGMLLGDGWAVLGRAMNSMVGGADTTMTAAGLRNLRASDMVVLARHDHPMWELAALVEGPLLPASVAGETVARSAWMFEAHVLELLWAREQVIVPAIKRRAGRAQ